MPNNAPFPLMPSKSTEIRLEHFDENVYTANSSTLLYKFLDAMCGDAGAGSLKKEIFVQRLSGAIDGIIGSDLDYVFGNWRFLSRAPSESYPYDPMTEMLTSEQWDEVAVKDAWFRARIVEFFQACQLGCQSDAIRHAVHAACSVDCEIFEVWRYMDNFGITLPLGRAPVSARNEVVIKPHKLELSREEFRLLRDMLDKFLPCDTIATIDTRGLSVSTPVPVHSIAASSTYYQVEKVITGTVALESVPPPEILAIDLDPTEQWLFKCSPELAPYACFNITSEYGYYYLVSGGNRSPIDSVIYGTMASTDPRSLAGDASNMKSEANFEFFENTGVYTDWMEYEKADSPDNYPGGKFGIHPATAPALNPDQSPYQFAHASQADYVAQKKAEVLAQGGNADDFRYRLPIEKANTIKRTYTPDLAIAYSAPARDSTVSSSCTGRRPRTARAEIRDPSAYIRS